MSRALLGKSRTRAQPRAGCRAPLHACVAHGSRKSRSSLGVRLATVVADAPHRRRRRLPCRLFFQSCQHTCARRLYSLALLPALSQWLEPQRLLAAWRRRHALHAEPLVRLRLCAWPPPPPRTACRCLMLRRNPPTVRAWRDLLLLCPPSRRERRATFGVKGLVPTAADPASAAPVWCKAPALDPAQLSSDTRSQLSCWAPAFYGALAWLAAAPLAAGRHFGC